MSPTPALHCSNSNGHIYVIPIFDSGTHYLLHKYNVHYVPRVKTQISSRYGLKLQPRLVDIIAAVPNEYKKV